MFEGVIGLRKVYTWSFSGFHWFDGCQWFRDCLEYFCTFLCDFQSIHLDRFLSSFLENLLQWRHFWQTRSPRRFLCDTPVNTQKNLYRETTFEVARSHPQKDWACMTMACQASNLPSVHLPSCQEKIFKTRHPSKKMSLQSTSFNIESSYFLLDLDHMNSRSHIAPPGPTTTGLGLASSCDKPKQTTGQPPL